MLETAACLDRYMCQDAICVGLRRYIHKTTVGFDACHLIQAEQTVTKKAKFIHFQSSTDVDNVISSSVRVFLSLHYYPSSQTYGQVLLQ